MGFLLTLVFSPPWLEAPWRQLVMVVFDPICHQLPERSFHVHGVQLAACHRCVGIYLGLVLGALGSWFVTARARNYRGYAAVAVGVAAVLMGLDWTAGFGGWWATSATSRLVTGLVFGVVAGWIYARALTVRA